MGKIIILVLLLAGLFASCEHEKMFDSEGTWICNPEPNVSIILTFNLEKAYISTYPNNLGDITTQSGMSYIFHDGDQYVVRDDTLYCVYSKSKTSYGKFVLKMLSSNEMNLHSINNFDDLHVWVRDYSFKHKN